MPQRLLILLLLCMLPAAVQAQDFQFTTNDGSITITRYTGTNTTVEIPATIDALPVTVIGASAFSRATNLVSVAIPNSITTIGQSAFYGCAALTTFTIPNSVTNIGRAPLFGCSNLTAILVDPGNPSYCDADGVLFNIDQTTLIQCPGARAGSYAMPNSVTRVEVAAFFECFRLTNITIGASVTNLGDSAFRECTNLASLSIPDSVTTIGWGTFIGCTGLRDVAIGNGLLAIAENAFRGCRSLIDLTIGTNVTLIDHFAFAECANLTRVAIPNNVTNIGIKAFYRCTSLTNVTVGNRVILIENSFCECTQLKAAFFKGDAPRCWSGFESSPAALYYLPGTTGWGPTLGGSPTALWNPHIQTSAPNFGVGPSGFGFTITGTTNIPIVVEASPDLTTGAYVPLQNCRLTNGSLHFTDPDPITHPARFYRIRSP